MTLEKSILNAIELTGRMEAALQVEDFGLCEDLLEIRGLAMAKFEKTHRASSESEILNCQLLITELVTADKELQLQYKAGLEVSAANFRHSMTSRSASSAGAYKTNETPACVDRKA